MLRLLVFLSILALLARSDNLDDLVVEEEEYLDAEENMVEEPVEMVPEPEYLPPDSVAGAHFFDNFQDAAAFTKTWTHSGDPSFPGRFQRGTGSAENPTLSSEAGIYVPKEAQRYAVFGKLTNPFDFSTEETFVVQYEVRLHEGLQCGGAYIKLLSPGGEFNPEDVSNESPYTVMFGPDKCGSTNKVHFIWKFKNPVTGEFVEHHLKNPPTPVGTSDKKSHVYTLTVRRDNTFEIFIDRESKSKGSLLTDFDPPLVPAKDIDDPTDSKPENWVDEAKIADPEASKPEEWDEDAPREILDPEASMPSDWLVDEPLQVADPEASEPKDWDEEDDGSWEAPIVPNPKCETVSGCGEWTHPMIQNPDYKGKWYPPMIDNPEYIGEWKAKQIQNPSYFEESNPFTKLASVIGIGIDIWTMQKGIEYDNIYVGNSEDAAYAVSSSWVTRKGYQDAAMQGSASDSPTEGTSFDEVLNTLKANIVPVLTTAALILISVFYFCCCGSEPEEALREQQAEQQEPVAEDKNETEPKKDKKEQAKAEKAKKDSAKSEDQMTTKN